MPPASVVTSPVVGVTALGLIHARALTTGDPRRILALMTASFGLGQMIGPGFAGYAYGVGDSFTLAALAAAVALVIAAALVPPDRQPARLAR